MLFKFHIQAFVEHAQMVETKKKNTNESLPVSDVTLLTVIRACQIKTFSGG